MNAKEELLEVVRENNLEILKIDCHFEYDNDLPCGNIATLEELDVEYDETFGLQLLYGEVYCIDKETHEPVWLTRREYDGSECWDVNRIPEFYSTNAEHHKTRMSWISVEERLPQLREDVLLYDKNSVRHYVVGWMREKRGDHASKWVLTNGYVRDEDITHWMPIPSFGEILEANKDVLKRLKEKGEMSDIKCDLWKDVNNKINELEMEYTKEYTQQEFVNTLMKDTPDRTITMKEQFKDVSTRSLDNIDISVLKGKTITEIEGLEKDSDEVYIKTSDGSVYKMFHEQDCCESVWIEDVCGDVEDLIGAPILVTEVCEDEDLDELPGSDDSHTWTFYKLATIKGYVDIRWYGTSNGFYSERVDFRQLK